jgi:hypothetical protein
MLSLIANALLSTAVNKPKITRDVVAVAISAATAFLMFSIAVAYTLSVLREVIIANANISPALTDLFIAGGCLILALGLAYLARKLFTKVKKERESPVDKALSLVDAFARGFNSPPSQVSSYNKVSKFRKIR